MNKALLITTWLLTGTAVAQLNSAGDPARPTRNWPVIIALQFHNVSMPFRDLANMLTNVGVSVGTEFSYNHRGNLLLSFQIGYYRNQYAGDGVPVLTQAVYRPHAGSVFGEIRAGVGWLYGFNPTSVMTLHDGQWQQQTRTGTSMPVVPAGVSLGYENGHHCFAVAPFVSYQFVLAGGYNPSVPVLPNQFFQIGSRIHLR